MLTNADTTAVGTSMLPVVQISDPIGSPVGGYSGSGISSSGAGSGTGGASSITGNSNLPGQSLSFTLSTNPGQLLAEAAGLTQNAFASDTGFFSNVMTSSNNANANAQSAMLQQLGYLDQIGMSAANSAGNATQSMANNSGGGGSYICTAVCQARQEGPDGITMRWMRRWRDVWMSQQPDAEKLFKRYAAFAPAIIRRIDKRSDAARVYKRMYSHFIAPAINFMLAEPLEISGPKVFALYKNLINYAREEARK